VFVEVIEVAEAIGRKIRRGLEWVSGYRQNPVVNRELPRAHTWCLPHGESRKFGTGKQITGPVGEPVETALWFAFYATPALALNEGVTLKSYATEVPERSRKRPNKSKAYSFTILSKGQESCFFLSAIQTVGRAAGRIGTVKTATATANWKKWVECCDWVWQDVEATVWLDADGAVIRRRRPCR
jgi:hypothetical protein